MSVGTEAVRLTLAADPARLPLARAVAVSCGALAALPMDRIDDLRQCTQEALAVLLAQGCTDTVEMQWWPAPGQVAVTARGSGATGQAPDPTSFALLLLTELAEAVTCQQDGDVLAVAFAISAGPDASAPPGDRP